MVNQIRVKFVSKTPPDQIASLWRPLLPEGTDRIGDCVFDFDPDARNYDFLAVYEGLPPLSGETFICRRETLDCAPENTLLITTEPSSIRIDGPHYLRQFGHIWTHKHPSLIRHPNQIRETPPLRFFYGLNKGDGPHLPISEAPPDKTKTVSAVLSEKTMKHTLHRDRSDFMKILQQRLPELDCFGGKTNPIADKAEAMAAYRYHLAIENHIEPGHFTEKLTDCFVAGCLPFYCGDPDYARIFPQKSVIPIDLFDIDRTVAQIKAAIANDEYSARRDAIMQARRITLDRFNTLRAVAQKVEDLYKPNARHGGEIAGRHAFRYDHPVKALYDAFFRVTARKSRFSSPRQQAR